MGLFGSKCVRCGHRTLDTFEDKPTCDSCRQEIELALAAAAEQQRACPVDGATLNKEVAHGVITDRCPQCKGVWLDAGELERINGDVVMSMVTGVYPVP
jgi:hypothetical protein